MKILNTAYFWIFCFTVIFVSALDFWSWEQSFPFLYLPMWVFYFVGLQVLLSLAIYVFSRTFWKTRQ
ncbi:MAG: hypothetical protein DRR08_14970 [Candidatus Parabeggiatoa sp. nov. 2]|nr:MAG: hypothetical protein DRR08_14970 [Gammaproteobacteria bacterium]